MSEIHSKPVSKVSAHELAPLIASHVQEQNRGAPRNPDEYYAELLTEDPTASFLGGYLNDELVGFCLFFDLPYITIGMRYGQIGDIFVSQNARGRGVARSMMNSLLELGKDRGWVDLRIFMPPDENSISEFFEKFATKVDYSNFIIKIDNLVRRG